MSGKRPKIIDMSEQIVYFSCENYLAQWFINESGGVLPVQLRKKSPENFILQFVLCQKSNQYAGEQPLSGNLPVVIPYYHGKDPAVWNAVSPSGRRTFIETIRKRFDVQLWDDMSESYKFNVSRKEMLYSWMESHGIELTDTNWEAVSKRLSRMRRRLSVAKAVKRYQQKKRNE